jgi:hypothetical protein
LEVIVGVVRGHGRGGGYGWGSESIVCCCDLSEEGSEETEEVRGWVGVDVKVGLLLLLGKWWC